MILIVHFRTYPKKKHTFRVVEGRQPVVCFDVKNQRLTCFRSGGIIKHQTTGIHQSDTPLQRVAAASKHLQHNVLGKTLVGASLGEHLREESKLFCQNFGKVLVDLHLHIVGS